MPVMLQIAIIILVLMNIGDRYNLHPGGYSWCKKPTHYMAQWLTNNIAVMVSYSVNALTFGALPRTISSRIGEYKSRNIFYLTAWYVVGLLHYPAFRDFAHCHRALFRERKRMQILQEIE